MGKVSYKKTLIFIILFLISLISPLYTLPNNSHAHTTINSSHELFSIWDENNPSINGEISFNSSSSSEWGNASIYSLLDQGYGLRGKIFIQNTNNTFYLGMDLLGYNNSSPSNEWGIKVFIDRNHDGKLTSFDKAIIYYNDGGSESVEIQEPTTNGLSWQTIESGSIGSTLPISNVRIEKSFITSYYENITDHYQFEFLVPFSFLTVEQESVVGFAIQASDNYSKNNNLDIWPLDSSADFSELLYQPEFWGDLHFGSKAKYVDYLVESNFRIKNGINGQNNGTFISTADINGDGDDEVIFSSNRSVLGEYSLITIYDYIDDSFIRIWSSWESIHQTKFTFPLRQIIGNDFDGDGKDELYGCGSRRDIIRLQNWNDTAKEFEIVDVAWTAESALMGYLTIGDVLVDGADELVFGDSDGKINVLKYESSTNSFSDDFRRSTYKPPDIDGEKVWRIHAIKATDMDEDGWDEIIFGSQFTNDNSKSTTRLQIIERGISFAKYVDNPEDYLPAGSSEITEDQFLHTILFEDIDNDNDPEIILAGKNYLKIFRYSSSALLLQINLTDSLNVPVFGGGAQIGDIDNDGTKELLFSANNGTLFFGEITITGSDSLAFNKEWSGDFGTLFGKRESMVVADLDEDGESEFLAGDHTGQLVILGKGKQPSFTMTSPSSGFTTGIPTVLITWEVDDIYPIMHHFDIRVNSSLVGRSGSGQREFSINLLMSENNVSITVFSINGKQYSQEITVYYNPGAPTVSIIDPENYFATKDNTVEITYLVDDPDGNFDHFEIYRNGFPLDEYYTETSYIVTLPSEGIWNITVVAVDDTPLKGKSTIFIIRDISLPSVNIVKPTNNYVRDQIIEFSWSASDSLSGISHFNVYLDDEFYDTTTKESIDVELLTDKEYKLSVTAFDKVGNYLKESKLITLDTILPFLNITDIPLTEFTNDLYITSQDSFTISWDCSDSPGTGIQKTDVEINGQLYSSYSPIDFSALIQMTAQGLNEIKVIAYDKAGNSISRVADVIYDSTPPNITITSPLNNTETSLYDIIIAWEAYDDGGGITEFQIYHNSTLIETISDPSLNYYQITLEENSTNTITIKAVDSLGHSSNDSILLIHNSSAPTIVFTYPYQNLTYINDPEISLTWDSANIELDTYQIYVNGTMEGSYSDTTFSDVINLGTQPNEYLLYNITLVAINGGVIIESITVWVWVDRITPITTIINPESDDTILDSLLHIEWSAQESGSGINYYKLKFDEEYLCQYCKTITSQYLDLQNYLDGIHTIKIETYDLAGNIGNKSVDFTLALDAPQFTTNLASPLITNNPNFSFNLSVIDPKLGVSKIEVITDNSIKVVDLEYKIKYVSDPFWVQINISETDFIEVLDQNNLTVYVYDYVNRHSTKNYHVIIDTISPQIFGSPVIDDKILNQPYKEFLVQNDSSNIHLLTVSISEEIGIDTVTVTISGNSISDYYEMTLNPNATVGTIYEYYTEIDFSNYAQDNYTLTFVITDLAGNTIQNEYIITVLLDTTQTTPPPAPTPPSNIVTYLFGAIGGIIVLIVVAFLILRKPIANIGWKESLKAVSYIMKNGQTAMYVPYTTQFLKEDQLFGGGMTGILSVLEEITGEKEVYKEVQTVEYGNSYLLIYPSTYGTGIAMVSEKKPKHEDVIENFTIDFENTYRKAIARDFIFEPDFQDARKLAEKYFGESPCKEGESELVYETDMSHTEESSPREKIQAEDLQEHIKADIGKAIKQTQQALTALIDGDLDSSESHANQTLVLLEKILNGTTKLTSQKQSIEYLPRIIEKIFEGIKAARNNDIVKYQQSVEEASQLFFDSIN